MQRKNRKKQPGEVSGIAGLQSMVNMIVDCIDQPCFAIDTGRKIISWNKAMERLTGIAAAGILGKSEGEYALPFYGKRTPMLVEKALCQDNCGDDLGRSQERPAFTAEETYPAIAGGRSIFRTKAAAIHDHDGSIIGALQTFHDITEDRRSQEDLRIREEKYRTFFENVTDFLYVHDFQGNIIETNVASKLYTGYTPEDMLHMNIKDIMPDSYKPMFDIYMSELREKGKGEGIISVLTKDGNERILEYRNTVVRDAEGNPLHIQGSGRDITDKIKAQRALKVSEERYRNILDSIEEAYFEVDLTGNFTFFNHTLSKNLKYEPDEIMGMNYRQYMDEENAKKVYAVFHHVFASGEPTKAFDWVLMDKNGEMFYVEASVSLLKDSKGKVIGFRGIVRDITQRKEAERERDRYELRLAQAQKLEAIGTLAGGIAHDFNNMLSAIIGYTELARNDILKGSRAGMQLDQVLKAGMRAKDLIAKILTFSRKYEAEREAVDVRLILNEALNLLRATIPTSIEISYPGSTEPRYVFADPTEIHQLVMNLCTNAYQAMDEGKGILEITIEPVELSGEGLSRITPPVQPGPYMELKVSDTGCGMDEDVIKRIFDPFFTTKRKGKGTGLGLATVQRIITDLKGGISVESSPGRGTTFSLYLPRHED